MRQSVSPKLILGPGARGHVLPTRLHHVTGFKRLLLHRAIAVLLATSVTVTGCATRPENVLQPARAVAADAIKVPILVATTRKPSKTPGLLYSGDRGTSISLNSLTVTLPPDHNRQIGQVQWPARLPANPDREFSVMDVQKVESEQQIMEWFRQHRKKQGQVLIFVHGFNNTYADAVFRLAQVVHDSRTEASPILFTWPSRGRVFDYLYDKESASYSRRALEDLILQAAKSPDVREVTILAHSMGGWLAVEALRGVAMREKSIPEKVRNVILASPDIDVDVFRRQFMEMGPKKPDLTILTSKRDKALGAARWLSGGIDRVGSSDPGPYLPMLKELGVTVIDTSSAASSDPLGHNAFADSPEVVRLLGQRLAGQPLEDHEIDISGHLGIKAATFAGKAARVAVMAPTSVISADARKALTRELNISEPRLVDGQISY